MLFETRRSIILFVLALSLGLLLTATGWAIVGDVDQSGVIDNSDTALLQEHLLGFATLTAPQLADADLNADGDVDIADLMTIIGFLDSPGAFIVESSPADGEIDVALTRETIIRFSAPLDPATVNAGSSVAIRSTQFMAMGTTLSALIHPHHPRSFTRPSSASMERDAGGAIWF